MERWPLPRVCLYLAWLAVFGGPVAGFFGIVAAVGGNDAYGLTVSLGGMIAFAAGLLSLTLLACFGPKVEQRVNEKPNEEPLEATVRASE